MYQTVILSKKFHDFLVYGSLLVISNILVYVRRNFSRINSAGSNISNVDVFKRSCYTGMNMYFKSIKTSQKQSNNIEVQKISC